MDAPEPLTPYPENEDSKDKTEYIDELSIKKIEKEYKIEFGINDSFNQKKMVIKVTSSNLIEYFFKNSYNQKDFQNLSKIFYMYNNIKEIITFLKTVKFEIEENNSDLILKFNVFLPNGENQLIKLKLKKCLFDSKILVKNLLEENKSLREEISKNKNEILNNKNEISKNKNEILLLKEENNKLWNEINQLKEIIKKNNKQITSKSLFDSKIINSIDDIKFILDYIKENDKSFSFNSLKLLYRGSKDGDKTEICHKLCDDKKNLLIIIESDTGHIFGGYCKIGFKINENLDHKIDNNCFLFSYDFKKIYPVIENKAAICHVKKEAGLCFYASLSFYDNFMNYESATICGGDYSYYFNGLPSDCKINGGKKNFICKDLEVFQLQDKDK